MRESKKIFTQEEVDFVLMARDVKETKEKVDKVIAELEKEYVTEERLQSTLKDIMPYISIVKGFCVFILMAVLSALVYIVVKR